MPLSLALVWANLPQEVVFMCVLTYNMLHYMAFDQYEGQTGFLAIDWSRASFSMDLPVFLYFYTKTSFKFLSRQGRYRAAFHVVGDLLLQTTQIEPYRALVLSRLKSVKVY